MPGIIYIVGTGPGPADWFTVKARDCLRAADAVLHATPLETEVRGWLKPDCECIDCTDSMNASQAPREIPARLIALANRHHHVVFLQAGDPALSRLTVPIAETLREAGISFEWIPGILPAAAAATFAGIPVTHRELSSSATFIHLDDARDNVEDIDWDSLANLQGTLVFLAPTSLLSEAKDRLLTHRIDPQTPSAIIRDAAAASQKVQTGRIGALEIPTVPAVDKSSAVLVVGEVVSLHETLNWFEKLPLFGRRIVITRSRGQSSRTAQMVRQLGGEAIECPTIAIQPVYDPEPLHRALRNVAQYHWVIFSSANAVEQVMNAAGDLNLKPDIFTQAKLAAIGPATQRALEQHGLSVALTPKKFVAEDMLEAMRKSGPLEEQKVLLPRAAVARDVLPDGLRKAGAQVDIVDAYQTVLEKADNFDIIAADLDAGRIDAVTFTSSSTAKNFAALLGEDKFKNLPAKCCLASIGPVTSGTLREFGAEPTLEAAEATIDHLIAALCDYFADK